MDFDCLRKNEGFSASSESIFKIPDATWRKIDAPSISGALAVGGPPRAAPDAPNAVSHLQDKY